MFNSDNAHQDFKDFNDQNELIYHFCLDKIKHKQETVYVMSAFFVNPKFQISSLIEKALVPVLEEMLTHNAKIWPLDPAIIAFLKTQARYQKIWYQKPHA